MTHADQQKGRLRTFLLGSLQNFLYNEYDRARALKRGGGRQIVSIDEHLPEAEAAMLATSHLSDAGCYDLVWASNIVARAWKNLQNDFVAEGKAEWLEELRPFMAGGSVTPPNQEQAATRLGVPIATLRTWLSRLRQRYRESLRAEVASTVSDPADIDGAPPPLPNPDGMSWPSDMDDKSVGLETAKAQSETAETCATCGRPLTQCGPNGECLRCLVSLGFLADGEQAERPAARGRLTPGPLRYAHFEVEVGADGFRSSSVRERWR